MRFSTAETGTRRGSMGQRWLLVGGLIFGLAFALGGSSVASGSSSSIKTCTKVRTGRVKLIAGAFTEVKCTNKGRGVLSTWDDHATTVALESQLTESQNQLTESQQEAVDAERYHTFLFGSTACSGVTDNFAGMNLGGVYMPHCMYGANLSHAILSGAFMSGVGLVNANLDSATMTPVFADNAIFRNATLTNANLTNSNLYQAEFNDANLTGANLSGASLLYANLTGANVSGVIWNHTQCPDATYSDSNGTVPESCIGHGGGL